MQPTFGTGLGAEIVMCRIQPHTDDMCALWMEYYQQDDSKWYYPKGFIAMRVRLGNVVLLPSRTVSDPDTQTLQTTCTLRKPLNLNDVCWHRVEPQGLKPLTLDQAGKTLEQTQAELARLNAAVHAGNWFRSD